MFKFLLQNVEIDDAIHSALSIEILHNFTLVHDDIMDQDHTQHKLWRTLQN